MDKQLITNSPKAQTRKRNYKNIIKKTEKEKLEVKVQIQIHEQTETQMPKANL